MCAPGTAALPQYYSSYSCHPAILYSSMSFNSHNSLATPQDENHTVTKRALRTKFERPFERTTAIPNRALYTILCSVSLLPLPDTHSHWTTFSGVLLSAPPEASLTGMLSPRTVTTISPRAASAATSLSRSSPPSWPGGRAPGTPIYSMPVDGGSKGWK